MATQFVEVNETPADITSRFTVGEVYLGHNGGGELRYAWVPDGDDAPTSATGNYVLVNSSEGFAILPRSGESLFVWSADGTFVFAYDLVP